jgi:hypothetical protein
MHWGHEKYIQDLIRNHFGKRPFGRPGLVLEDDMKMSL